MAEIRPSEISDILRNEIKGFEGSVTVRETGRVLSCGDGIARIYGLQNAALGELLEFPHGIFGMVLNLEEDNVGAALFGDPQAIRRGRRGQAHRPYRRSSGRRSAARARGQCAGPADRRQGTDQSRRAAADRNQGAGHHPPPAGQGAAADRNQGDRLDAADRARPARADHRRPPDRQDRDRARRDHQPARPERAVLLRRDRAEALDRRPGGRQAQPLRRDGIHHGGRGDRFGSRPAAIHRAV